MPGFLFLVNFKLKTCEPVFTIPFTSPEIREQMQVLFSNQQRKVKINRKRLQRILGELGSLLDLESAELSLIFVNNRKSREINSSYRGIDRPTDVLSFPMHDSLKRSHSTRADYDIHGEPVNRESLNRPGDILLGDIVINTHRTVEQAEDHGNSYYEELTSLLIHGLLHLIGYDHEKNYYQARKMKKKELELLHAVEKMG